jgi:glutaminyl-tRNA synthetase
MGEQEHLETQNTDFIRERVKKDVAAGTCDQVVTRFPPEPNGYLHIGHAKALCLDFGIAAENRGQCNLRFDDTNPTKEETEYVDSIKQDIRWLGFEWGGHEYFASDYFEKLYEMAEQLVDAGLAYIDDLSPDEIRENRGTLTEPGTNSPYRNRSVDENLDLFRRMRNGEFDEGSRVLRAKIDMASPNLNMRDPVMYRILKAPHHRTGTTWPIYPMYDWAHGQSDSIEGVTHSLCDLAYEDHRPLYDWFVEKLGIFHPQQIEFARLNITKTVLSKRMLRQLVEGKSVSGWDDPRMPTLSGLRRRGYTSSSVRAFIDRIGVSKTHSVVDIALLEYFIREELNADAHRVMAVLDPVKLIIDNYPEGETIDLEAENNPEDETAGNRTMPFSRTLYIERSDFREDAPKKYFRLAPGKEVRLKHAFYVTCTDYSKDDRGNVSEIHCTYDPATKGGWSDDGRKVKGTLHWVSAEHALPAEVRLYDYLFDRDNPEEVEEYEHFTDFINEASLEVKSSFVEPSLSTATAGDRYQFLRNGYFCVDPDSSPEKLVLNRIVSLRDSWAKIEKKINNPAAS